jgi:hypothetical protein
MEYGESESYRKSIVSLVFVEHAGGGHYYHIVLCGYRRLEDYVREGYPEEEEDSGG